MPDQTVELAFKETGIDALQAKIDKLAASIGGLQGSVSVGGSVSASGGSTRPTKPSGPGQPKLLGGPTQSLHRALSNLQDARTAGNPAALKDAQLRAYQAYATYQKAFGPKPLPTNKTVAIPKAPTIAATNSNGNLAGTSMVSMLSQVRVTATAVAQASAGGAGAVNGLVGALSKLPPHAQLVAAGVAAVGAAFIETYHQLQSALTPSFTNGNGSFNSSRGVFRTLGTDNPFSKARSLSDALNSNPFARAGAYRAGINPNNSLYGGDIDDASKAMKWLKRYGDPSKSSESEARRQSRATGDVFSDELARLRAASPDVRRMALSDQAAQLSPDKLRAAADAQLKWNHLVGEFSDLAIGTVSALTNAWKWLEDHLPGVHNMIGPAGSNPGGANKEQLSRDRNSDAIERNTDAMNKVSNAVSDGRYGGGGRFNGAVPDGWGADQFQRGTYRQAARLGVL